MTKRRSNNEGSIWKENKKWRAAVTLDGKRLTQTFCTRAECANWIRKTQNQIAQGMTYTSANITLGTFIKKWFTIHNTSLSPTTATRYEQIIQDYIIPQFGTTKLKDIKLDQIEIYYQSLLERGLSSRSVRNVHTVLHKSLNDAIRRGYIGYNPSHGAILPRLGHQEMEILDENEVMHFLIAIRGHRNEALYILAIKTGIRKGELLGLKWSDLNWQKGTLRIQRQVQRIPQKGFVFRPPKTRYGKRTIQLGENTLQELRHHCKRQQREKEVAGDLWKDLNLIFPSTVGTPQGSSNLNKGFKTLLEKANIKKIRFHDLRHTAASLMLNHGVPVLIVSKILGHSKTSTTLDIYGHLIPVMLEQAAQIMDEIITPIPIEMGEMQDMNASQSN